MHLYYRAIEIIRDAWWDFRKRCQRFKRGYASADVWDIDQWFVETVKPMLIHLRTHGNTYPIEFSSRDEWCAVLDEMIKHIDLMDENSVLHFLGFVDDDCWRHMTIEDHKQIREAMFENKNKFFELFSKYFYNLWD